MVWLMNGASFSSSVTLDPLPGGGWDMAGVADFDADGDGDVDILWRNNNSGVNLIWIMNGATHDSTVNLPDLTPLKWRIVAVGDYNADGMPDIVWRNSGNGSNKVWLMSGTSYSSTVSIQARVDTNWHIVGPN